METHIQHLHKCHALPSKFNIFKGYKCSDKEGWKEEQLQWNRLAYSLVSKVHNLDSKVLSLDNKDLSLGSKALNLDSKVYSQGSRVHSQDSRDFQCREA